MHWIWQGLYQAALMGWETGWALVLGFSISAAVQTFVSKPRMGQLFGRTNIRSMALATGFGAASSSCSYAAAAAARSAFRQGAALVPALAFMFASTNLVFELGAVLWLLLGWRFVAAEVVGAFVLIGLLWTLARLIFPADMEQAARTVAETDGAQDEDASCHAHGSGEAAAHHDGGDEANDHPRSARWHQLGSAFVMDWQMLWKEIVIGFMIAGFLSVLVPAHWWQALFLSSGPGWLRLVENAFVGPLIAAASFVCSVGNLPLAGLLWSDGISFGGVISFIYADLLIVPLVLIYRKSFGPRAATYITLVLFLATVAAGIVVDIIFSAAGWVPTGPRPVPAMQTMHLQWNYTSWLDLAALAVAIVLWTLHRRGVSGDQSPDGTPHSHQHHH